MPPLQDAIVTGVQNGDIELPTEKQLTYGDISKESAARIFEALSAARDQVRRTQEARSKAAERGQRYMVPNDNEIFDGVRSVVQDVLKIDEADVHMEASLEVDLGAESLDFFSFMHKLAIKFDIETDIRDLFPKDILADDRYTGQEVLSNEDLLLLKERLWYFDLTEFEKNPVVEHFAGSITVIDLYKYVEMRLAQKKDDATTSQ